MRTPAQAGAQVKRLRPGPGLRRGTARTGKG